MCSGHQNLPYLTGGGPQTRQRTASSDDSKYFVKHYARLFVEVAEDAGLLADGVLDDMSVKDARRWFPDQDNSLQPVEDQTVGWARSRFGLSPFLAAAAACFAGALKGEEINQLLDMDLDQALWLEVQKWVARRLADPDEEDCWPPTYTSLRENFGRFCSRSQAGHSRCYQHSCNQHSKVLHPRE